MTKLCCFDRDRAYFIIRKWAKKPVDQGSFCPVKGQCVLGDN